MKPIQVGLMGMGTVGSGTFNVLQRNQSEITRRAGRGIEVSMVADLDIAKAQAMAGPQVKVVSDARQIIANPEIDIVVELIGGYGIAKTLVLEAIAAGKHVVTANKAMLAMHGADLAAIAEKKGAILAFEAAVAGGAEDLVARNLVHRFESLLAIFADDHTLTRRQPVGLPRPDPAATDHQHTVFTITGFNTLRMPTTSPFLTHSRILRTANWH